jgi:hypothetical protein
MSNIKTRFDLKYLSTALGFRTFTDLNEADIYCVEELFEKRLSRKGKLSEIENLLSDDDMESVIKKTSLLIIPLITSIYDSPCEKDLIEEVAGDLSHSHDYDSDDEDSSLGVSLHVKIKSVITSKLSKSKIYKGLFAECYIRQLNKAFSDDFRELFSSGARLKEVEFNGSIQFMSHDGRRSIDITALPVMKFNVTDKNVDFLIDGDVRAKFTAYLARVLTTISSERHSLDNNCIRGDFYIETV